MDLKGDNHLDLRKIVIALAALLSVLALISAGCAPANRNTAADDATTIAPIDEEIPPDENAIREPNSDQWILRNELVVFGSPEVISGVVDSYHGEISIAVPETSTYQIKFPVSALDELSEIKQELESQGIEASYVQLMSPK